MQKIDPKRTALVILDLQNDVIHPKGKFADSGSPLHAKQQNVVGNVKEIAAAGRAKGMPIIHIHMLLDEGTGKLNAPLFQGCVDAKALVRGTWGAEALPGVKPQKGDLIVEKQRMSGFHNTLLDTKLRGLGVDKVLVTGAWTNFSVEHTCRDGADLGYQMALVTDGTSTINDEWQKAATDYALTNIAERVTTAEVLKALGAPAAAKKAPAAKKPAAKKQ
jgi:nicotinamidase-related amidase